MEIISRTSLQGTNHSLEDGSWNQGRGSTTLRTLFSSRGLICACFGVGPAACHFLFFLILFFPFCFFFSSFAWDFLLS